MVELLGDGEGEEPGGCALGSYILMPCGEEAVARWERSPARFPHADSGVRSGLLPAKARLRSPLDERQRDWNESRRRRERGNLSKRKNYPIIDRVCLGSILTSARFVIIVVLDALGDLD